MQLLLFSPQVSVANFYISRALRIYPVYWTLVAVTVLTQPASELWGLADHLFIKFLFLLNTITIFGHDVLTLLQYDPQTAHFSPLFAFTSPQPQYWVGYNLTVLGPAWSLSVELLFYAMAPFLLRLRTRRVSMLLLFSLCIKLYIASFGVYESFWIDAFFPAELVFFLSGAIAFRAYHSLSAQQQLSMVASKVVSSVAGLALVGGVLRYGHNTALITSHWFALFHRRRCYRTYAPLHLLHVAIQQYRPMARKSQLSHIPVPSHGHGSDDRAAAYS